VISQFKPV